MDTQVLIKAKILYSFSSIAINMIQLTSSNPINFGGTFLSGVYNNYKAENKKINELKHFANKIAISVYWKLFFQQIIYLIVLFVTLLSD